MGNKIELKKVYGDLFFEGTRDYDETVVIARWFGPQSVETVKEGGAKLLEMMVDKPYTKLLNCNKGVVGSWDLALEWVQEEWTPLMRKAGLRYLAQVVPNSIYVSITIENLIQRIGNEFEIRTFGEEADALDWLLSIEG
ncbi:hypothetical protein [Rufibacter immobilis]|uniref:hypothetical protein n=1 Tax=Rufibacter immobilis TaxID=1348778 RepID=UPI0035E53106